MHKHTSLQYVLYASPERVRKMASTRKFISFMYYFSGIIYAQIIYFKFRFDGVVDWRLAKYLSIVYVAGLLVYNLIVRNKLVFQERKYNFFPTGFEIISLKTNQVSAKYLWSDFKFFSLDKGCVDKQALVLNNHLPTDDKNIYLKLNKFGAYITVVVDHAYYEQLYKLIKEYLPEKFYGR